VIHDEKNILLIVLIILLAACNKQVTEEELSGGEWVAKAAYEDGEIIGEPNCYPFEEGFKFKDEDTVYNTTFAEDFSYELIETKKGTEIVFHLSGPGVYRYDIKILTEDELVMEGLGLAEGESCYVERH